MKPGEHGFTLLEVLIALVVLALSLGAAIRAVGEYTVNQAYLRDRTFAEWVARNQLVTTQLSGEWPSIGRKKGEAEMPLGPAEEGGREWRWVMQVTQTPEEDLRRLDIDVFPATAPEDADPSASLSGFMGKPK
jgi:general secretion pathway protein I